MISVITRSPGPTDSFTAVRLLGCRTAGGPEYTITLLAETDLLAQRMAARCGLHEQRHLCRLFPAGCRQDPSASDLEPRSR